MRTLRLIIHQEIAHHKNGLVVRFLGTQSCPSTPTVYSFSFVLKVLFANSGETYVEKASLGKWPLDCLPVGGRSKEEDTVIFREWIFHSFSRFIIQHWLRVLLFIQWLLLLKYARGGWVYTIFYCVPVLPGKSGPMFSYNFPVHLMSQYLCTCCIDTPVMNMSSELDIYCHSTMWPTETSGWKAKEPHRSTTLARMLRSESVLRMTHYSEF